MRRARTLSRAVPRDISVSHAPQRVSCALLSDISASAP